MENDFLDLALPAFNFLLHDGCYRLAQQEASASFDNGFLIFESTGLHIQVARERGQFLIYFASASNPTKSHWYDFDVVRRFLNGSTHYEPDAHGTFTSAVPLVPVDSLAALLQRYLPQIEFLFAADNLRDTETDLDRLRRERGRVIFR